jgi:Fic family protein
VAEVEAFRGWWEGAQKPAAPVLRRVREDVIAGSAASSARVAGTIPAPAARGYAEALRAVFDGFAAISPSSARILSLHAAVFRHCADSGRHAGRFKSAAPRAGTDHRWVMEPVALRPPGPLLVPAQMEALERWLLSRLAVAEVHPILVSAAYLLEFLAIRPFAEGNGRVSRLLSNLLLLRCGHAYLPYGSLEKAIAGRWDEYYLALRRSQASRNLPRPDISPWLIAFLDALAAQQRDVREAMARLPDERRLSGNQAAVVAMAARTGEVTNRGVASELSVGRDTAKQALGRLVALGALRRLGAGRATRYRLPGGD